MASIVPNLRDSAFKSDRTPALVQESFLLIFRISHIVTAVHEQVVQQGCITHLERRVVENSRVFQHIADCAPRRRRREGQHLSPAERLFLP